MTYRKILCAVDFSDVSLEALRTAAQLARDFGARLSLAHIYDLTPLAYSRSEVLLAAHVQAIAAETSARLADWRGKAEELALRSVDTFDLEGVAWQRIVQLAREGGYDLVVVGTHGRSGLRHALLGSVAERVVRHAPCQVLVVPPGGRP